jgi:hypothetical protein
MRPRVLFLSPQPKPSDQGRDEQRRQQYRAGKEGVRLQPAREELHDKSSSGTTRLCHRMSTHVSPRGARVKGMPIPYPTNGHIHRNQRPPVAQPSHTAPSNPPKSVT